MQLMKKYVFGIDIGGTTIKFGLFEMLGNILDMWEIPTRTEESGMKILSDIAESIENKLKETGISKLDVKGIGMGVPGPIGPDGTVLKCVNLGWGIFNVEQELSGLTGFQTKVANDANIAALGEMWKGGGKGYSNLVMVTLGTGVGGGVVINERILHGINGAAGEIGHLPMNDMEINTCGCGKKGCLEQYASANGITSVVRQYLEGTENLETVLNLNVDFTSKDIFNGAKAGDRVCLLMVDKVGNILGRALASISCVINPEIFVIGGGMSKAGDILIDAIKKHYLQYTFHASRETVFKLAELGKKAGIYGAARLILE